MRSRTKLSGMHTAHPVIESSWSQHGECYQLAVFPLVARFSVRTDAGVVTLCEARRKAPTGRFETKWLPNAFRNELVRALDEHRRERPRRAA